MDIDTQHVKKHRKSRDIAKKSKIRFKANKLTDRESESERTSYQKNDYLNFNSASSKRRKVDYSDDEADLKPSNQISKRDSGESPDENMNSEDDEINDEESDEIHNGSGVESDDETNRQTEDKEELKAVKEELSHMSFEELHQLKEKLGAKVFNQVMHGTAGTSRPSTVKSRKAESLKTDYKRANKSRPMEMTSKKTVSRFRNIIPVKKKVSRDPRFDDLSGEFSEEYFQKSYSFLNDVKTREKQKLQKQLRKTKDEDTKLKVKSLLNRMTQQQKSEMEKTKKLEQTKEWTRKEKELVAQGKKPFFLKKSDKKRLELADKYRELQKSGTLDSYLTKKRKKNSQKQRKKFLD